MRKLTLKLDELEVESFHLPSATKHLRGTVRGADGGGEPLTITLGDTDTGTIGCMSWWPCTLATANDPTCALTCAPEGSECV